MLPIWHGQNEKPDQASIQVTSVVSVNGTKTPLTALTETIGLSVIAGLILLVAFLGRHFVFQWPQVWNGDEPHYLITLSSLIEDGDLDLGNNYMAVHRGGRQAGRHFRGAALDHHTTWWQGNARIEWSKTFQLDVKAWQRDDQGHPVPTFVPGHEQDLAAGAVERSTHPPGLAWLLASVVWSIRGTPFVEPIALLSVSLGTIVAMVLFHRLIGGWVPTPNAAVWITGATFLGTPVWRYSRSLYTEGPLTLCAIGAYALTLADRSTVGAGFLIGAGTLMKPPFLLLALPLGVWVKARRGIRELIKFMVPCALAVAATLASNWVLNGAAGRSPQPFKIGNPLEGAWGLLFSLRRGLFWFAPVALGAVAGWPKVWRRYPAESRVILSAIVLYCGLMMTWVAWDGGDSYGPRLIVPIIPFAMIGLLGTTDLRGVPRFVVLSLGALSTIINFLAAGGLAHVTNKNLIQALFTDVMHF
jgi:hypothetical protein